MKKILVTLLFVLASPFSAAVLIDAEVPDAYILNDFNGLDWAWGGPCAFDSPSCGPIDLTYQADRGWRMATLDEIQLAPDRMDFVFAGALGDNNGTNNFACAATYFNSNHDHCDWVNAPAGGDQLWSFGYDGEVSYAEALVVRGAAPVPEPGSMALLGLGLLGLGYTRRKAS